MATLKIIDRGDVPPGEEAYGIVGGRVRADAQFMPSTFLAPGGGLRGRRAAGHCRSRPRTRSLRRRIISPNQAGAAALRGASRSSCLMAIRALRGARPNNPCRFWASRGVTRDDGRSLGEGDAGLLLIPAGRKGPAFLVTRNFDVVYS